jgi:1,2-diacylglycerol 3-alpha-glucosyltransferase
MPKVVDALGWSSSYDKVNGALQVGFFTEVYRPVVNGVVESVDALASGLREAGHQVYCFAPKMRGSDENTSVLSLPSLPLPANTPYRLTLPLVSRRHINNVIKRLHVIHVHSLFVTGWTGLRYARRYGMPIVYTYHTQLEAYAHYVPFEPHATRFAASQLTRTFGNLVDAVIVPTPAMADHLREMGIETRIEVIPSGIDVDRFAAGARRDDVREKMGARRDDRMVLFVSRLAKEKNAETLLSALAAVNDPGVKLAIAGDGPARGDLEGLANELGVGERVRFLGNVPRESLPDYYASADLFAFPSTTETQGLVQAEALAAGAAVIAADVPSNRDVIGDAGRLIDPTPSAFARAIASVEGPPSSVDRLRARERARAFSVVQQVDRVLDVYRSLLDDRTPVRIK